MDPTLIPSDGSAAERPEETGGGLALDPEAAPSIVKLDDLRKANPTFRMSWENDRKDMTDQSASTYDVSMATIALGAGWPDQEVVNLLICWRRRSDGTRPREVRPLQEADPNVQCGPVVQRPINRLYDGQRLLRVHRSGGASMSRTRSRARCRKITRIRSSISSCGNEHHCILYSYRLTFI